jgi:serine/threonine protein kinase
MSEKKTFNPRLDGGPAEIGGFRVIKSLGQGGMGQVYEAIGPNDVKIAIKVLPSYFAQDNKALKRFRAEVANLKQIDSERVARFIASGTDSGSPWLATELIEGESLKQRLSRSGPLRDADLVWFASELLTAIADLHDAGIVHGDIKPENIMLTRQGQLKLIDFGISQAFGQTVIQNTGTFAGSPEWMSPEAFESINLEAPTDVFSAGSVITFAARGHSPWATKSGALNMAVALSRISTQEPNLDGLPEELKTKVLELLAKDPSKRPTPRSAAAQILEGASYRSSAKKPRQLINWILASTVFLLLGVGGVTLLLPGTEAPTEKLLACAEVRHFATSPESLNFDDLGDAGDSQLLSAECSTETTKFEVELCSVIEAESFEAAQDVKVVNKSSQTELPLIWDPETDYLGCRSFEQLEIYTKKKAVGYLREVSAHPVRIEQEQTEYMAFEDGAGGLFRVEFSFPKRALAEKFIFVPNPEPHIFELNWIAGEPAWVFPGQLTSDFFEVTDRGVESAFCWSDTELEELDSSDLSIGYQSPLDANFNFDAPFEDIGCGEGLTERAALLPLPLIYATAIPGQCMPFELVFPKTTQAERRFEFCVTMDPKKTS